MAGFAGYSGQAFSPAGDKGRFVLPPTFRKAVKESSGGAKTLCLMVHEKYDCLVGFGLSRIEELQAQLEKEEERAIRLGQTDFEPDVRAQQLFGFEQVPFDDSGRFVMPDHIKDLGKVDDALYFHGAGRFFFVWNPEELARMDASFKGAQATCRSLMAKAKGGGK